MAADGYVMLSADYCQMELRMMAEASGDAGLCAMLRDPAQDPFRSLAARWKNVRPWQVRPALFNTLTALVGLNSQYDLGDLTPLL